MVGSHRGGRKFSDLGSLVLIFILAFTGASHESLKSGTFSVKAKRAC